VAEPRAFLSFDFDHDAQAKVLFAGQCRADSPTPFTVQDWSSKEALPQRTWERTVREKIGRTNMVIVLVGKHMGSATGVVKEIAMAKGLTVPVFGVYVNGAGGSSALPGGLRRSRVVAWEWGKIAAMANQMMAEGKNG
jgi:antiphage defense system Thoeris ThsB-like protein